MESLQRVTSSAFVIISATSVIAKRTTMRAPMGSSQQIECNFRGATLPFPARRLHSTVSSLNSCISYAHVPYASWLASQNTYSVVSRIALSTLSRALRIFTSSSFSASWRHSRHSQRSASFNCHPTRTSYGSDSAG